MAHELDGTIPRSYFDDYYNRIHIVPSSLYLGSVISTQVRAVDVWNAYMVPKTLTAITGGAEGIAIDGPATFPMVFGALQLSSWDVSVTTAGPASVAASYAWSFTGEPDALLDITGSRVIAWQFQPDWLRPVIERLEWMTSLARAYSGKEQRMRVRHAPRASWEFSFNVHGQEANMLDAIAYDWQAQVWALPIWPDGGRINAPIVAGDSVVQVDTTTRDYHAGGLALVSNEDGTSYEAFEIAALTDSTVTSYRPLGGGWPSGSPIFPVRTARLAASLNLTRLNAAGVSGIAQFQCTEAIERDAATEATYRGFPVMTEEPNWRDRPAYSFGRELQMLDNQLNPDVLVDDGSNLSMPVQAWLWTFGDRAEQDTVRKFLYARQGRYKQLWVPTWSNDLHPVSTIASAANNIDVVAAGLAQFYRAGVHRRDIRIELNDGTVFYRRCSSYTIISSTVERLTIDAVLGITVEPADIRRISWMMLCRLDVDTVEISWNSPATGEVAFSLAGFNNVV